MEQARLLLCMFTLNVLDDSPTGFDFIFAASCLFRACEREGKYSSWKRNNNSNASTTIVGKRGYHDVSSLEKSWNLPRGKKTGWNKKCASMGENKQDYEGRRTAVSARKGTVPLMTSCGIRIPSRITCDQLIPGSYSWYIRIYVRPKKRKKRTTMVKGPLFSERCFFRNFQLLHISENWYSIRIRRRSVTIHEIKHRG